jgi:hypothetical protein
MDTATETATACDWCGEPATYRDKTQGDASCEACARDQWGFRRGEAYIMGFIIEQFVEVAKAAGASHNEIRDAVDRALKNEEPILGAQLDDHRRATTERKAGVCPPESDRFHAHFEPLVGEVGA